MTTKSLPLLAYEFTCPPVAHVRPVWRFIIPSGVIDTNGDEKRLFGANLARVPLRLFRAKPLSTQNIISVQDKGTWSQATPAKRQTPAVRAFELIDIGGQNDQLSVW